MNSIKIPSDRDNQNQTGPNAAPTQPKLDVHISYSELEPDNVVELNCAGDGHCIAAGFQKFEGKSDT